MASQRLLCFFFLCVASISLCVGQPAKPRARGSKGSKDDLRKEIARLWRDVNSLKEMQALQTVCLRGTKVHKKCFLRSRGEKNYHAANEDCIAQGGTLAIPRDGEESTQLRSYAKKSLAGGAAGFWIGVNDMTTEGRFVDVNGQPVSYLNWGPAQPRKGTRENCALASVTGQGKWSAEVCREVKRYVCEFIIP